MSTSYDGSLLDHLAEYILYLSTASSFWYSIDSSYDHDIQLSKRLGMSPEAYGHPLGAANHAQLQPSWYFFIKTRPRMWQQFIDAVGSEFPDLIMPEIPAQ